MIDHSTRAIITDVDKNVIEAIIFSISSRRKVPNVLKKSMRWIGNENVAPFKDNKDGFILNTF